MSSENILSKSMQKNYSPSNRGWLTLSPANVHSKSLKELNQAKPTLYKMKSCV